MLLTVIFALFFYLPSPVLAQDATSSGQVLITEFMANPEQVSDTRGEWVEVQNISSSSASLEGWKINDGTNHLISGSYTMETSSSALICRNSDPNINGGLSCNYTASMTLSNDGGSITLKNPSGSTVDSINYLSSDVVTGHSNLVASDSARTLSSEQTHTYGLGDFGTPGSNPFVTPTPSPTPTPEPTPTSILTPTPSPESVPTVLSDSTSSYSVGNSEPPGCFDSKPGSVPIVTGFTVGENKVTLNWLEAVDPVSYYLITYGLTPGLQQFGNPNVGGRGTKSYTVEGLSGGSTYYFRVRAGNGCSPGEFSNELSAVPAGQVINTQALGFQSGILGESTSSGQQTENNAIDEFKSLKQEASNSTGISPSPPSLLVKFVNILQSIIALIFGLF